MVRCEPTLNPRRDADQKKIKLLPTFLSGLHNAFACGIKQVNLSAI
jgi:hypothetical protein